MQRNPPTIEMVRGRMSWAQADEVLGFWAQRGALAGEDAQRRLPEVVCLLRDGEGLAGVSSVYAAEVELVGGRRFWIYRSLLDQAVAGQAYAMIRATFYALDAEFDGAPGSPIGLCALLGDAMRKLLPPEAEWADPRMIYAGYLDDGRQVRIAYFNDARVIDASPGT